jgi:hypothetical protein
MSRRKLALIVVFAPLLLSGCGGSSKTPATSTAATAPPASTSSDGSAAPSAKRAAVRHSQASSLSKRPRGAVSAFASCLTRHGVRLPQASNGAGINLKGVDTASPTYRKAFATCQHVLIKALDLRVHGRLRSRSRHAG